MATRYFKSTDGHDVCSTSSGNRSKAIPGMPKESWRWIEIDQKEFRRLKMKLSNPISYRVNNLANTSVQDMQSGMWAYEYKDLNVLQAALKVVKKRGEKTKAKVIETKIRKLLKGGS